MTITPRITNGGETRYCVQVYNKNTGKRESAGTYGTRKAAERAERQRMSEIETRGRGATFKDITVGDMIEKHLAVQHVAGNTLSNYRLFLRRFRDYVGTNTSIHNVGVEELEYFIAWMKGQGFAGSVIHLNRNQVSSMFDTAMRYGYITVNPGDLIANMPKNEGVKRVRAVSIAEHIALIEQMPDHFKLLVEVWPRISARPSEMYGLQVGDFDPKEKTLRIERQFRKGLDYAPLKHDAAPRTLHLDDKTRALLRRQVASLKDKRSQAPLFPSYGGHPIDRSWFPSKVFRKAKTDAGIQGDVTPHSLRHTGATWLLESGASVAYVARHLGHKNPAVTMRYYADVLEQVDKSAMSRLEEWHKEMAKATTDAEAQQIAERVRLEAIKDAGKRQRAELVQQLSDQVIRAMREEDPDALMRRFFPEHAELWTTTSELHSEDTVDIQAFEEQEQ